MPVLLPCSTVLPLPVLFLWGSKEGQWGSSLAQRLGVVRQIGLLDICLFPELASAHDLSLGLEYRSQTTGPTSLGGRQVSTVPVPPDTPRSSRGQGRTGWERRQQCSGSTRSSSPEGSAFKTAADVLWCSHCHIGPTQQCSHSLCPSSSAALSP